MRAPSHLVKSLESPDVEGALNCTFSCFLLCDQGSHVVLILFSPMVR